MRFLSSGLAALAMIAWGSTVPGAMASTPGPTPTCHGKPATIVGTPGSDDLRGTPGDDVIVGLGGDDLIHGLGGKDVICGGDGSDTLYGGSGDDRLHGGRDGSLDVTGDGYFIKLGDTLNGGAGRDLLAPGYDKGRHTANCPSCGYVGWYGDVIDYTAFTGDIHLDLGSDLVTGHGTDRISAPRLTRNLAWGISTPASHLTITGTSGSDLAEVTHTAALTAHLGRGHDDLYIDHSTDVIRIRTGPGDDGLGLLGVRGTVVAHLGAGDDWVTSQPQDVYPPEYLYGGTGRDQAYAAGNNTVCFNFEEVTTA